MRITAIRFVGVKVNRRGDWIFLLVDTDEGLTGLGEASHSGSDAQLYGLIPDLESQLVGRDPNNINALRFFMKGQRMGRIGATAWSAVEQACQDIRGQALGQPICNMLGGPIRDRVRLYANINRHVEDRTPSEFARAAAAAAEEGFMAVKLAPFDEVAASDRIRSGQAAEWQKGLERVRAVRSAVGPTVEIAVDCHSRFDLKEALTVAQALEEMELFWFEEPIAVDRLQELSELSNRIRQPLATAESLFGLETFCRTLRANAADVIMPDVKHAGGIQETWQIGHLAESFNVAFAPHNPSGPVATAASVHIAACVQAFTILEYAWGEVDWRPALLHPPEEIQDGHIRVSNTPGLGHSLNPELLQRYGIGEPSRTDSSKARV